MHASLADNLVLQVFAVVQAHASVLGTAIDTGFGVIDGLL
jgi:hypothetical protein